MNDYSDLKPIPGEERFVEYDEEFEVWAVFGEASGFCYAQRATQEEAEADIGS